MIEFKRLFVLVALVIIMTGHTAHGQAARNGWTMIDSVTPRTSFLAIECADAKHCVALGNDGLYYRSFLYATTDGGLTWRRLAKEEDFFEERWRSGFDYGRYRAIAHPTPETIVVVAMKGWVLSSSDRGATWTSQQLADTILSTVHFLDDLRGVITGKTGLQLTTDGGRTWRHVSMPRDTANLVLDRTLLIDSDVLMNFSHGRGRSIFPLKSNDFGETWSAGPAVDGFHAVDFIDPMNGWVAASRGTGSGEQVRDIIYRTTDGGLTWPTIHDSIGSPHWELIDIAFADELNGIASGKMSKVQMTTDGGVTWTRQYYQNEVDRFGDPSVEFPSPDLAFMVSFEGGIYRWNRAAAAASKGGGGERWFITAHGRGRGSAALSSSTVRDLRYAISNIRGEIVARGTIPGGRTTVLEGLGEGAYFVRATDGTTTRSIKLLLSGW